MITISLKKQYNDDIANGRIISDPAQLEVLNHLELLLADILRTSHKTSSIWGMIKKRLGTNMSPDKKGIYLWGSVGSGKTYLADAFFECLPVKEKLRMHFHRFMQRIHYDLKNLNKTEDPLQVIADDFARQYKVICFDEFHVSDITDAMILGGLLKAFVEREIIFVTTSNVHPDNLYKDGLQRSRFMPAIELIKQHMQILTLNSDVDYRLRYLGSAELYHYPLDDAGTAMMQRNLENIAPNPGRANRTIEIEGRKIQTVHCADGVVWFDFAVICNSPRGPADYIEIARQFQTVLIQNIPQMGEDMNDQARRFITLVDEFYDRHVKLIITAEVDIHQLYQGGRLKLEFQRTQSRLIEMRNIEYLGRPHLTD